jgi:hypothetical protein
MASRTVARLGLLLALVGGCVVSPQPSPPDIVFDGDLLGLNPGVELVAAVSGFQAAPGTVSPPKGVVVVTNLDDASAPSVAEVQPDGSFAIAVPGFPGQRYRFQAKDGDARSLPFDVRLSSGGDAAARIPPEVDCLVLTPGSWLSLDGPGDVRSIVLTNQCDGAVSIAPPRLRRGLGGFSLTRRSAIQLAPGDVALITVLASTGSEPEDLLLLDVVAPVAASRAITLTVPDR